VFQDLNRHGKTVIIVTHEEEIAHHCKRIIRFRDGRILKDEIIENPIDALEVLKKLPRPDDEIETEPAPVAQFKL
jgi:putative ABC transport system ATP-binding protein